MNEDLAARASELERKLQDAVHDDAYPAEDLPILQAAAIEVAELEYVYLADIRQIWWSPMWKQS